jgi:hypothetical protein
MGRIVDVDDVISAIDKHIFNENSLDEDISVILEEVPTAIFRPTELYAVEDCISGKIIFNARGGCYKDVEDVADKIARLTKENDGTYRMVKYVLSVT